jgi:hypothetical protein
MTVGTSARRPPTLVAGDAVRWAAGVSLVVGTALYGLIGAALLSLVLLAAVIPRALGLHGLSDPVLGAVLSAAAWMGLLDLYAAVPWLDLAVHLVATGVLAALAWRTLVRVGAVTETRPAPATGAGRSAPARPALGVVVVTTALGVMLAVLWELGEWAGATFVDGSINVGYTDTLGDLAAGATGSLAAGIFLARRS